MGPGRLAKPASGSVALLERTHIARRGGPGLASAIPGRMAPAPTPPLQAPDVLVDLPFSRLHLLRRILSDEVVHLCSSASPRWSRLRGGLPQRTELVWTAPAILEQSYNLVPLAIRPPCSCHGNPLGVLTPSAHFKDEEWMLVSSSHPQARQPSPWPRDPVEVFNVLDLLAVRSRSRRALQPGSSAASPASTPATTTPRVPRGSWSCSAMPGVRSRSVMPICPPRASTDSSRSPSSGKVPSVSDIVLCVPLRRTWRRTVLPGALEAM